MNAAQLHLDESLLYPGQCWQIAMRDIARRLVEILLQPDREHDLQEFLSFLNRMLKKADEGRKHNDEYGAIYDCLSMLHVMCSTALNG